MHDQANHLRRLVRHCGLGEAPGPSRRPSLIVVAGGKGGAGTTTIAVNLAVAMSGGGRRTVLVDADLQGGGAAILCGLEQRYSLADVLAARRSIHEVLQPGPCAVQFVPGVWGLERMAEYPAAAGKRLLGELEGLAGRADLLLLDGGKSPHRAIQPCWQTADLMLLLTTPETPSILNTYALIKMLAEDDCAAPIHLLVNLAPSADVAREVWHRLAEACRRFLGIQLTWAGHLPADPHVAGAAASGEPFVLAAPDCGAARYLVRLADTLAASLAGRNPAAPRPPAQIRDPRKTPPENPTDSGIQETPEFQKNGQNDSTSYRPQPIESKRCR